MVDSSLAVVDYAYRSMISTSNRSRSCLQCEFAAERTIRETGTWKDEISRLPNRIDKLFGSSDMVCRRELTRHIVDAYVCEAGQSRFDPHPYLHSLARRTTLSCLRMLCSLSLMLGGTHHHTSSMKGSWLKQQTQMSLSG